MHKKPNNIVMETKEILILVLNSNNILQVIPNILLDLDHQNISWSSRGPGCLYVQHVSQGTFSYLWIKQAAAW